MPKSPKKADKSSPDEITHREKRKKGEDLRFWLWVSVLVLLGVVIALVMQYIHATQSNLTHFENTLVNFASGLGFALISIGIVGIVLEFRDWRQYFQQRLAEIIVKREYLNTLDPNELISLQTDTIKAFFRVDDIDREGSFLNYFHSKIHRLIGSPYRENYNTTILLKEEKQAEKGDDGYWLATEVVTYKCRKVGDKIQEAVLWMPSRGERIEKEKVRIEIRCPANVVGSCERPCEHEEKCGKPIVFTSDMLEVHKLEAYEEGYDEGYKLSLAKFHHVDGLKVKIVSTYLLPKKLFSIAQMAYPSRGASFTIRYPDHLQIKLGLFGLGEDLDVVRQPGLCKVKTEAWVLPDLGVAYQVSQEEGVQPPDASQTKESDKLQKEEPVQ